MHEELIKRMREHGEFLIVSDRMKAPPNVNVRNVFAEDYYQAADAIEDLIAALTASNEVIAKNKPRWIPVTERLPEFDQKVLAWVKNKDQEGRFNKDGIYTAELKDKMPKPDPEGKRNFWGIPGYDSVWTVWSWSYFTEPDVLFWMPLPEPPKEET